MEKAGKVFDGNLFLGLVPHISQDSLALLQFISSENQNIGSVEFSRSPHLALQTLSLVINFCTNSTEVKLIGQLVRLFTRLVS